MMFFDLIMDVSDDDLNNVKIWFSKVYMIVLKVVNCFDFFKYVCMCVCVINKIKWCYINILFI